MGCPGIGMSAVFKKIPSSLKYKQMIKHCFTIPRLFYFVFVIVLFQVPVQKMLAQEAENPFLCVGDYQTEDEAKQQLGEKEPYDSEILSRENIRKTPPDILMTNYVMLDLIFTRFEDADLFLSKDKGQLKFLVLDEMHTYTGHRGADVATRGGILQQLLRPNDPFRPGAVEPVYESQHASTGPGGRDHRPTGRMRVRGLQRGDLHPGLVRPNP